MTSGDVATWNTSVEVGRLSGRQLKGKNIFAKSVSFCLRASVLDKLHCFRLNFDRHGGFEGGFTEAVKMQKRAGRYAMHRTADATNVKILDIVFPKMISQD